VTYTSTDEPSKEDLLTVESGLEQHNHSVAPLHEVLQLAAFARNDDGVVVGGAVGRTWGKCCELLELWVDPSLRSNGVGSELLRLFESHARNRDCSIFYLTTLSYQAPDFYLKHGYTVIAQIDGYPNEIVKYLMQKIEDAASA